MKNEYCGIGLMSGTSMDGLDLAACRFYVEGEGLRFEIEALHFVPFDATWHARLQHLNRQDAETYARTHVYFGHWLGSQVRDFIHSEKLEPDFVASHGQTIFHQPDRSFTAQIGDGETLAAYLPCPLVSSFRNKNVALGGEGAPLIPLGEQLLFPDRKLFLNLGGFANISYAGSAFDLSPCNLVLNRFATKLGHAYDEGGKLAATGTLSPELLSAWDGLDYYHRTPPKSLGREWVEQSFLPVLNDFDLPPADILRTLVEHIAGQIASACDALEVRDEQMMVSGGGFHNAFLMDRIEGMLAPRGISIDRDLNPRIADFKEAIVFAALGLRVLLGQSSSLASATGSRQDVVGGAIHLPPDAGRGWFGGGIS